MKITTAGGRVPKEQESCPRGMHFLKTAGLVGASLERWEKPESPQAQRQCPPEASRQHLVGQRDKCGLRGLLLGQMQHLEVPLLAKGHPDPSRQKQGPWKHWWKETQGDSTILREQEQD